MKGGIGCDSVGVTIKTSALKIGIEGKVCRSKF